MSSRSSHLPAAAGVPDAVELFHVRCHPGQRPDFFRESRSLVEMKPCFGLADCAGWLAAAAPENFRATLLYGSLCLKSGACEKICRQEDPSSIGILIYRHRTVNAKLYLQVFKTQLNCDVSSNTNKNLRSTTYVYPLLYLICKGPFFQLRIHS